jgi:hypothetical protein
MSDSRKDMPYLPETITFSEIADALDTLVDIMISNGLDEVAGHKASFWRDAALLTWRSGGLRDCLDGNCHLPQRRVDRALQQLCIIRQLD